MSNFGFMDISMVHKANHHGPTRSNLYQDTGLRPEIRLTVRTHGHGTAMTLQQACNLRSPREGR